MATANTGRRINLPKRVIQASGYLRKQGLRLGDEARRIEGIAIERIRRGTQTGFIRKTRSVIRRQKKAVLDKLPDVLPQKALKIPLQEIAQLFDIDEWTEEMSGQLDPEVVQILRSGFRTGLRRIDIESPFDTEAPIVRQTIIEIEQQSRFLNATTQEEIADIIQRGISEQETVEEIAERIGQRFDRWAQWRPVLHARTAGNGAFEAGQQKAFEDANIPKKEWMSQRDSRVRGFETADGHWEADEQRVPIDGVFMVRAGIQDALQPLRFPGDPAGHPENIVNCRCSSIPIIDE